jgi:hypothetical protein
VSTKAQAILEEIQALPPDEQEQVVAQAIRLRERAQEWARQKAKLREMQSRHTGRGLLSRLLAERAKERARA